MSRNRISSRQVCSGPLAPSQTRAGDGIRGDVAGASGSQGWKSTEPPAGSRYGATRGVTPRCPHLLAMLRGLVSPPESPPDGQDPVRGSHPTNPYWEGSGSYWERRFPEGTRRNGASCAESLGWGRFGEGKTAPKIFARAFFGPVASCALLAEMRGPPEVLGAVPPVPGRGHPSWMLGDPVNAGGTLLTQRGPPALLTLPLFFYFIFFFPPPGRLLHGDAQDFRGPLGADRPARAERRAEGAGERSQAERAAGALHRGRRLRDGEGRGGTRNGAGDGAPQLLSPLPALSRGAGMDGGGFKALPRGLLQSTAPPQLLRGCGMGWPRAS